MRAIVDVTKAKSIFPPRREEEFVRCRGFVYVSV